MVHSTMLSIRMASGADQPLHIGLHQHLQHRLGKAAEKIPVTGLLHQFVQCHSVFGVRFAFSSIHRDRPWF